MPDPSLISSLLQRLRDSISPTWASGWRWNPQPLKPDYDRFVANSEDALAKLRGTGDWRSIPSLLDILCHDNAALRTSAAAVIANLASLIPNAALPGFETRLRASTLQAYSWHELSIERIAAHEWPPGVWALFSMHPSGFVREAAVRHLSSSGDVKLALPYMLLRINDWVGPVRTAASVAVRSWMDARHVASWVPVLGMVDQLRARSRVPHDWLTHGVTSLFLHPDSRPELMKAIKSDDRSVARWAFLAAMNLPDADRAVFIWLAFENADPLVRLRAATAIRAWKECPGRDQLLNIMASDRFMPIRRESLYAALDDAPETRQTSLRTALLDRHASMRHAARFYLRDQSSHTADPFDARAFYRNALSTTDTRMMAPVIAGLGECGDKADAEALATYVSDRRASIAAAAVRAIASLDRDSRIDWFIDLVSDDRSSVAKEACRALVSLGNAVPTEPLRRILRADPREHACRFALRVLLRRHPYDAVVDAITAAGSSTPSVVRVGTEFIERVRPWSVSYGPSEEQKSAAHSAIAALSHPLPENLNKRLRHFMGTVT